MTTCKKHIHHGKLADVWSSDTAPRSYQDGKMRSYRDCGPEIQVLFRNKTPVDLTLCWCSSEGILHHYYCLKKEEEEESSDEEESDDEESDDEYDGEDIMDERGRMLITSPSFSDCWHRETTRLGHAFVILEGRVCKPDKGDQEKRKKKKGAWWNQPFLRGKGHDVDLNGVDPEKVIGGYRPMEFTMDNVEKDDDGNDEENEEEESVDNEHQIHVITITREKVVIGDDERKKRGTKRRSRSWDLFCGGSCYNNDDDDEKEEDESGQWMYKLTVCEGYMDRTPLDTTDKVYEEVTLGGWPFRCEEGLWDEENDDDDDGDEEKTSLSELKSLIISHIQTASKLLPPRAVELLRSDTPFYLNKSQLYGPKLHPISGRGMCYHPDAQWLIDNGMNPMKARSVEMYRVREYDEDCDLWGEGGVFLHELSHAWHHKHCLDGYHNEEVKECYEKAMEEGLYDSVRVHGCQGPEAEAYATENAMEYFAELSAAFLGGIDRKRKRELLGLDDADEKYDGEEEQEEFNKWFPFNRSQIKDHDPRAYEMLKKMWGVGDDGNGEDNHTEDQEDE